MEIYDLKARVKRLNASIAFMEKEVVDNVIKTGSKGAALKIAVDNQTYDIAKSFNKDVIKGNKKTSHLHDALVLLYQERNELGKRIQRLRQAEYEDRMLYERAMAIQKAKEELELAALNRKVGWIMVNGKSV